MSLCPIFLVAGLVSLQVLFLDARRVNPPPRSDSLCMNNGHVLGKWTNGTDLESTKKTFYSCGWGYSDYRSNPQLCGWRARHEEKLAHGDKEWLMQTGGYSSHCDIRDNTRTKLSQRERYKWEPMLCDLIPWNATQFCELLGNRTILMIGDSTMQQTAGSIMSHITTDAGPIASCAPQLSVGRTSKFGPRNDEVSAISHINAIVPDILILNSGAHFSNVADFKEDLMHLDALQKEVRRSYPKKLTMVWKTMNPGHLHCGTTEHAPLSDRWSHHPDPEDIYNWFIFAKQDSYAKQEIARMGMELIDMSPLYYRPDALSDCLHYCLPGPVDLFSVLLLNMLYNEEI